jgi:signal transduction histidine kinase
MGLSISKEIIEEKHGGRIDFESEPGRGTTFHICIPVRQTRSVRQ